MGYTMRVWAGLVIQFPVAGLACNSNIGILSALAGLLEVGAHGADDRAVTESDLPSPPRVQIPDYETMGPLKLDPYFEVTEAHLVSQSESPALQSPLHLVGHCLIKPSLCLADKLGPLGCRRHCFLYSLATIGRVLESAA